MFNLNTLSINHFISQLEKEIKEERLISKLAHKLFVSRPTIYRVLKGETECGHKMFIHLLELMGYEITLTKKEVQNEKENI